MRTVTSKAELVEELFVELDESKPRQPVDPSFLLRVGGTCHGMIYGGFHDNPPYLEDIFGSNFRDRHPTMCGTKLVAFAQALANEGWANPTCRWTISGLVELMLEVLNSADLRVQDDSKTGLRYVVSTDAFVKWRGSQVRVRLGQGSPVPLGRAMVFVPDE